MNTIQSIAALEALYQPAPVLASTAKELDHLIPEYRRYIELSPFVTLATVGPEGLDCSPRGDASGFVRVIDDRTLALPDRRGNNRIDSLRNIVRDPRVALLFLIPGSGSTFRVNGRALITDDESLRESFAVDGKPPRTVLVITIERAYFQCARAIVRSRLWQPQAHIDPKDVPTPGQVLQRTTAGAIAAKPYDDEWPERAARSLW
jgi:PPOX class probable FMN-dependent enzyme